MKGSKSCSPAARAAKPVKKSMKPFGAKKLASIDGPAPLIRRKRI